MWTNILKNATSEQLLQLLKSNQEIVQLVLHKIDAYKSFGDALNNEQQIYVSNNLNKVNEFFKSKVGKDSISILADEFVRFCK